MSHPCSNCPFRSDRSFPLRRQRAVEIANAVLEDGWFPCHKTTNFDEDGNRIDIDQEQPCIGAALFIETVRGDCRANLKFRLVVRDRKLDPNTLNRSIPVYQSAIAFIEGTGEIMLTIKYALVHPTISWESKISALSRRR